MTVFKNDLLFSFIFLFYFTSTTCVAQKTETPKSLSDQKVEGLLKKASASISTDSNKAFFYLNKALAFKDEITEKQLLQLYKVTATTYYNQQSYIYALDYFYKSLELQKKVDPAQMHYIYNNIGCVYMDLGDIPKSRSFLTKSLEGLKKSLAQNQASTSKSVEAYLVYSNLAVIEMETKNYKKAIEMLQIHKKHSIRLKDSSSILSTYKNLSNSYDQLKIKDSSRYYFQKGTRLAHQLHLPQELGYLQYQRGLNFSKTENDSAQYYLKNAFEISKAYNNEDLKFYSAKALADEYEYKKDYQQSNKFLRIANVLSDTQNKLRSEKKIEVLEFENKQKIKEQEALAALQQRENFFIFGFILLIPISVSGFLLYRLQRTKNKKRKIENELLTQKMEIKNKELTSNALQMLQASEIIDATHNELKNLKTITDLPTNKMLNQIISDLKQGNQSFNKKEFEKVFIETDAEFYRRLIKEYPTLTKNEIRLCAFAKLGFSVKEISAITQQTSNSILVARSRLRKKIGLAESQSITVFFKSF